MNNLPLSAMVITAALMGACGGGGSGSGESPGTSIPVTSNSPPPAVLLGTFNDAPVVGATYTTSSGSGGCVTASPCTTNSLGQFVYGAGDTITFFAAGVNLGTTKALQPNLDGSTTVTPVNMVSGATSASDSGPTAIAQLLQTLSFITTGASGVKSGLLTMPTGATAKTLQSQFSSAGVTAASSMTAAQLQAAINTAFGAGVYTVVPVASAQTALNRALNSNGIVGTVWSGPCTSSSGGAQGVGTLYFRPDGVLSGYTNGGRLISGSWFGSSTAGAGVQFQASTSRSGGADVTGAILAGANSGTADVTDQGVTQCTFTFSKSVSSVPLGTTKYLGGWYGTYSPSAAATTAGLGAGSAYIVMKPDENFSGITDGGNFITGTWTVASGMGVASLMNSEKQTLTLNIDLASQTGTVTNGSTAYGSLAFTR